MIELSGIQKTFNAGTVDEKKLFDNFNLKIDEGEFVAVIGSNGSGKTTMLNIISGSTAADSGKILLGGAEINKLKDYKRAMRIGRVFQDPAMGTCPSMTIWENLSIADNKGKRFGLSFGLNRARKDFYRSSLEFLGMGLEDRLDTPAGTLSGGQRQALALIMATLVSPDLLLLDEHTAALDPKAADTVMELTDKLVREKKITSLMVTHNLRYAVEYGTRTIMMHEGGIVLDVSGEKRRNTEIDDYLKIFNEISLEKGN
ncbi:MAG TPA: ABC transporter ATP-binding protein [Candidatus Ornithomonoglobus intestinigallinarum]|uniref:ABC transporter ATP-binding protein n=1 Tax=Candidatus Ornithomonoglobus intestinigallinarum TaxID=2840894 RepID=A0A9D1H597_9FIRM|nr:ABC transporter ATP-binding protein [Candidatus Ornithomonoglobus intestinigallinarum]